jgi:hypothetical protein
MIPESMWPGMFQADAKAVVIPQAMMRDKTRDTVASYAISDEQGARKNALDNRQ